MMGGNNESGKSPMIIHLEQTDSTNSHLRRMLSEEKLPEGSVLWADFQCSGRGQVGNTWESEAGKNLTFSLVIYPTLVLANHQFLLSQIAALSIKETLDAYVEDISVKWPNDIYWKDRKICGMLIENDLIGKYIGCSIIGIGLNVNQRVFRGGAPNPVSLGQIKNADFDCEEILSRFLEIFYSRYMQLLQGEEESIQSDYCYSLYRKEGCFPYHDDFGNFNATILRIEPDGHLILELPNGEQRRYAFKEVEFVLE